MIEGLIVKQVADRVENAAVIDRVTGPDQGSTDGLSTMAFSRTWGTQEQDIRVTPDEITHG
jgi:hypothetical protein